MPMLRQKYNFNTLKKLASLLKISHSLRNLRKNLQLTTKAISYALKTFLKYIYITILDVNHSLYFGIIDRGSRDNLK